MSKFRNKSVVIEAERWYPDRAVEGVVVPEPGSATQFAPFILTLEGPIEVRAGDWIITGVEGEKYPCKPEIFELTYEPIEPAEPTEPENPAEPESA